MDVHEFSTEWKRGFYEAIARRRDMRAFEPDPIPDATLARILQAANQAASVGFSQPWNFLLVRDPARREALHAHVTAERLKGAERFEGERREKYLSLKLEGILEAPLNVCITCDRERFGPAVLGRNTIIDADLYSVVGAVQNFWLAARVEGVGVGWVSILRQEWLAEFLGLPDNVVPVAYLCVGYVKSFPEQPTLQTRGWLPKLPLAELVYEDRWGSKPPAAMIDELGLSSVLDGLAEE